MNEQLEGQLSIFDFISPPKPKPIPIGTGAVHRFLRYGPHTLIPEVEDDTRRYLEQYGVPDWVKWDKNSLPCVNCTWYDGRVCRIDGHTCHYEFGYLICDGFAQSITERKPSTVGDIYPSKPKIKIYPVDIRGLCDDAYCPQCNTELDDLRFKDCPKCPWCGTRIDWTPWHRANDEEEQTWNEQ